MNYSALLNLKKGVDNIHNANYKLKKKSKCIPSFSSTVLSFPSQTNITIGHLNDQF